MDLKPEAVSALAAAMHPGVTYADVRVIETRNRNLATKNGQPRATTSDSLGIGIRVLRNGCWGFAATDDLTEKGIQSASSLANSAAVASAGVNKGKVELVPEQKYEAVWVSPYTIDPFSIAVDEQLDLLLSIDSELRRNPGISLATASFVCERSHQVFASSIGSMIDQTRTFTGVGYTAHSFRNNELQVRSYPAAFDGREQLKGYEIVDELKLSDHVERVADEAVALHSAKKCPEGRFNLILEPNQLALQIHESIGHPIELDRVLGLEANFAGMSFLTLDKLNTLRYGSDVVNVVCDARLEHGQGLGTFAFDDEGVPAQCTDVIRDGEFCGYMTSRETAAVVGELKSNGTMRASNWSRSPLIRMTNVSLLPGEQTLEEVFGGIDQAIYMETNRSLSIDDKRHNFQFGCEIAWEIKNGKRVQMLKNPTYGGLTTEFWNQCEAIADRDHWALWGVSNCGKGQPEQVVRTGHGASHARFRNVRVGVAYAT